MAKVEMIVEQKILSKESRVKFANSDNQEDIVGKRFRGIALGGMIGLREHRFGEGVRSISSLITTCDSALMEAMEVWKEYMDNQGVVYRFSTSEPKSIKLLTTEVMLGTRKDIYPASVVIAQLSNVILLTQDELLNYSKKK